MMTPIRWAAVAVLIVAGTWGALRLVGGHAAAQVAQHVAQAEQQHVAAVAAAAQGGVYDQQVQAQAPKIAADAAAVDALRAQLAALRARPVPPFPAPGAPVAPEPVAPPVDLVAQVAKQQELIDAQGAEIKDQAEQIHTLTLDRDAWRAAYDESSKEATERRLALEGQLAATKAALWRGRVEGLVVGLGVGYASGKL